MALKVIYPIGNNTGKATAQGRTDVQNLNIEYDKLDQHFLSLVTFFWTNPFSLTPQQAFDTYGYEAADMYLFLQQWAALRNGYAGLATPVIPPAGHTVTSNADGSVTAT